MEIQPMLLTETYDMAVLEDTRKWFQIKENGVRAIVHVKDHKVVGIRNRSGLPILYCFPEFKDIILPLATGILDAEICVFKAGKSVFYGGIDQRRSTPSASVLQAHRATMVLFDALKIESEVLLMKPYKYRYEVLCNAFQSHSGSLGWQIAMNYPGAELWERVVKENLEGVVVKDPNAIYELGKRSKQYLKIKNYKLVDVVVDKTEANDKGTKIFGKVNIDGTEIDVEAQLAGIFGVVAGVAHTIKYLDIQGHRLIQPTKVNRTQMEAIA